MTTATLTRRSVPVMSHAGQTLHLVAHEGEEWFRLLRFRDALLRDPRLAERYACLKTDLVGLSGGDRDTYTRSKSDFVKAVLGER